MLAVCACAAPTFWISDAGTARAAMTKTVPLLLTRYTSPDTGDGRRFLC
jgi:hypothetical protein